MTTTLLYILVAILGMLVCGLLGATVELFRSVDQLRRFSGFDEDVVAVDLGNAKSRSIGAVGLPNRLISADLRVLLFLSDKCATCRTIAQELGARYPAGLAVVLIPSQADAAKEWKVAFDFDERSTFVDSTHSVVNAIGVRVTPVAIMVENGVLSRGVTVSSYRQIQSYLSKQVPITGPLPTLAY